MVIYGTALLSACLLLGIAAGLFGGYRIWGTKDKEPVDIKQLLQKLEEEVDLSHVNDQEHDDEHGEHLFIV